jgi:hypothetical protein
MKILVHLAAGGVGSMLVCLGKIARCEVIGVLGRSHKVEHVRGLGADHVIDKSTEDLSAAAERLSPKGSTSCSYSRLRRRRRDIACELQAPRADRASGDLRIRDDAAAGKGHG